jgi:hypothetical protein
MNEAVSLHSEKYREREKRVGDLVRSLPPVDLVPLALAALHRMAVKQKDLARRFPLEDLARIELIQRDINGF